MTDSDPTGNSEVGTEGLSDATLPAELRRRLKSEAARANAAEAQLQVFERENTFRQAGLDPQDPRVKYFVKGYDGELDAESIRQEAAIAGFGTSAQDEPGFNENISDALDVEQRIVNAGQGGDPVSQSDPTEIMKSFTKTEDLQAYWATRGDNFHWNASQ